MVRSDKVNKIVLDIIDSDDPKEAIKNIEGNIAIARFFPVHEELMKNDVEYAENFNLITEVLTIAKMYIDIDDKNTMPKHSMIFAKNDTKINVEGVISKTKDRTYHVARNVIYDMGKIVK